MVWCTNCAKNITRPDSVDGKICCSLCGRVLDEDNFSQEPTFVKNSAGQSKLSGTYVRSVQNESSVSRERTMNDAIEGINSIMYALGMDGGGSIANPSLNIYEIALERNFTRGRRKDQVLAACLYIVCRQNKKPYLLIDFSEHLRVNVYVLGAVFLHLCKLLSLQETPMIRKPVDPSLFIHRFTDRLFGGRNTAVSKTALHILASMKRDWMQTGRKPSGLCGAALYISALSYGLKCSKSEIIKVVHVCETTLTKRLIEFENTESGGLTIDEFNMKAAELENEERLITSLNTGTKASEINELLCEHKLKGKPHFAHGLCKECYEDFINLSGGLDGESEPPAFQRAEMERSMAKETASERPKNSDSSAFPGLAENRSKCINFDEQRRINNTSENEVLKSAGPGLTGATEQDRIHQADDDTLEESQSLSDIDDSEVEMLLYTEEEKKCIKVIWEHDNKEYLKEQADKEAAAMLRNKDYMAYLEVCSGDVEAAKRLAAEAVEKAKKERRQKRAEEMKNVVPARTAHEATRQVLEKKRLSNKVNYNVMETLFSTEKESTLEQENLENTKKRRTEQEPDHDDNYFPDNNKGDSEVEDTNVEGYDYEGYAKEYNYDDY